MKIYLIILLFVTALFSCQKDDDFTVTAAFEKADVTSIACFNENLASAVSGFDISVPTRLIIVRLKPGENIKKLKINLTLSAGATVIPALATGFLDYSEPKIIQVVSPGGTIAREWTILIYPAP